MNYKEVIESRYNREAWQQLIHDIFLNKVNFWNQPSDVRVSSRLAKQAFYLGKISLTDGESIAVYEVELTENVDIERNRRGIRDMLTTDWRNMGHAGAFMFCYRKKESVLRFSYVSETWGFNKQGEYEKTSTDTKRYTYLLGEGRGCRTAIEQFKILRDSKQTLSDITAAFSVEALTKQFYKDLFGWYQWAIEPSSNITFPNNTTTRDDDRDDIETKVIRMITRIMFVWFIKQKNLVPDTIFEVEYLTKILKNFDPYSTTEGNYYNAILQNLFFGTLNRAIEDEDGNTRKFATSSKRDVKTLYRYAELFSISEQEVIRLFGEIPFLNGGLFECLDKTRYIDGVEQCYNFDGFSRNDGRFSDGTFKHRAIVPNNLFFEPEKGLISILSRYNFTIEENSPEEQQVALDPELLGKVFENLLGAYNPETKETARNQSGSFYTPREIVNYMVDESLIAYLGDDAFVRSLFSKDFSFDKTKKDEYQKIADKLKAVKILDPACGSGAFPMGLLNRMIDILERISPNEHIYDLKLSVIENCLYGSDIQSIAAQITKLRFFISLICDCEKDASKPNFGIPTLPNLETKFVSANSLIAKKKNPSQKDLFENPEIEPTKNELAEIRHKHFSAKSASAKHRLREKDQALREKLAKLLSDDDNFAPEDAKQLVAWNPYDQNSVSPFFDPEWMFGVTDGFDIVIGNPPYISTKGVTVEDKKKYEAEFGFSDDTYNLFTFKGMSLLKNRGSLSYIIPKTFWTTQTKKNMRDLILGNQINYIFDTANPFEAVMVDTCIIQVIKHPISKEHKIKFLDGTKDLLNPISFDPIEQNVYTNTQNSIIFKPTSLNLRIYELYGEKVKELYNKWWSKIETSKKISQNKAELETYRANLKPGDIALLGCLTEGGQGLATANNGKYVAVRRSTKWAKNIIESRPKKLAEAIKKKKVKVPQIEGFESEKDFLNTLSEHEIADLFDSIKEQYGRDIFGQGYIYKIIEDDELANVEELTDDEKENGIDTSKKFYVPYDKGDKDGNRWYLETPFAIAWSKENVHFLKTTQKKGGYACKKPHSILERDCVGVT
ncbi:Modification methylase VspI [Porphyromonas macacae]|uniref:site-specific DNA-methyltransferase (adenine-specific) n=1 Tax=Porphyromonas macacae TaxID=28115 RepID=A0A379EBC7_9PORP|nr:Eco57I restriction-modification methylase domain-containing protein [Porphyromonas macacae]SUB93708.1 Modification methylase VspI [Porphyromonas macacae]